jgi:predicted aldo/keto reductase-like oxidoreductase
LLYDKILFIGILKERLMEKRKFGNTGLEVSLLGFGGYHLLEIPKEEAVSLLNQYLDRGGNYIETAAAYGAGESERKIGLVMETRRDDCVLVSKSGGRDGKSFRKDVEQSLQNLRTDHLDVILMHAVRTPEELDQILGVGGAFEEALKLKEEGKVKHIGLSMHGQPDVLIDALNRAPFEVVMTTINYYDVNNFPEIMNELVPLANEKGVGIILMKPVGDGLLWKNVTPAFQYAFSMPVSTIVTGMNSQEMFDLDMQLAEEYTPLPADELMRLQTESPELGNYVCRQCGKCVDICPEGVNIPEVFRLEGVFDRQMRTGEVDDFGDYIMKEQLRFWFQGDEKARREYSALPVKADACVDCGVCATVCPYEIDIPRKLRIADYKLADKSIY